MRDGAPRQKEPLDVSFILSTLPLLKILLVFAAMLTGIRLKLGLGLSILAGSLLLAVVFGMGPLPWLVTAGSALIQKQTFYLGAIVALILVLSSIMDASGQADRFMNSLKGFLRRPRLALVFFPALIGLLPMPGGAVFSAPMVARFADRLNLSGEDKVLLNYWFRHVWELAWPLYPGVILASSLAGVPIGTVVLYCLPAPVVCILLGWFFVLRSTGLKEASRTRMNDLEGEGDLPGAMRHGLPLLISIVGAIGLEGLLATALPGIDFELGVTAALAAGALCAAIQGRLPPADLARIVFRRHVASMLFVIAAIFVFKEVLTGAGVVEGLANMAGGNLALVASAVLLPFLVGWVSGITIAFVGSALPLMLALLGPMGLESQLMAWLVLFMLSGFTGVMASPMHLCFILTCRYFETDLGRAWRRLLPPSALLLAFAAGYFLILR